MKKLRRVTEAEIVAEFLKNEFYEHEFHRDRDRFERLVMDADLTNQSENALRLALLFRRRAVLWRNLPADTQWWEVRLESQDIGKVRVFPRAQWRRVADGSFQVQEVAERIRQAQNSGRTNDFLSKIQSLSYRVRNEHDGSSLMFIGVDDQQPLTIMEGNHRFTAALLVSPEVLLQRFRFYCGFSPYMTECCWYHTSLPNLWRYAKNRARHLFYDPDAALTRVLPSHSELDDAPGYVEAVSASKVMPNPK